MSYRRGPLGAARFARTPRAGDRIGDLPCVREDGTPGRLHAELGGRWAVLIPNPGTDDCVAAARQRLGQHVVPLRRTDNRAGEAWLVRPDAHLAWRGRDDDVSELRRWLDGALGTERARR